MEQIDYVAVATCTGYVCPGISSFLIEAAGLRPDVRHADLVGMGCGAAIPAIEAAYDFVTAHPGATAAIVCTEICSAAFFSNDNPDIVISNTLFADGSAALLLRSAPADTALKSNGVLFPEIVGFESLLVPEWRDKIRFRSEGGYLRNVLAKDLPEKAASAFDLMSAALLDRHGLRRDDVKHWVLHPGGARVLDAFQARLNFRDDEIRSARTVLRENGNMSSPSVLFVLAEELRRRRPEPGSWGVLSAFGAGFSAYACLVRF
jgi:alkylresorcinol/alkylpyrone synthase